MEHRVSFNCMTKRVILRMEENSEIMMIRDHRGYMSNVVSALVVEELVRKGCIA